MKTVCCSDKCERRYECAKHEIHNELPCIYTDFYHLGNCLADNVVIDDIVDTAKDCSGCVFENADGSTPIISVCVSCNRINDFARYDWYMTK